jgi:hypothetical protein
VYYKETNSSCMLLLGSRRIHSAAPSPPLSIEVEMLKYFVYRFNPVPSGKQVSDSFHRHQTSLYSLFSQKFGKRQAARRMSHVTRGLFEAQVRTPYDSM